MIKGPKSQFDDLVDLIPSSDYALHITDSISEALDIVKNQHPVLIIMDLQLANKDGIEITTELRNQAAFKNTTIVVCSDRKENYVQVMALNAGADDFLVKPINKRVFESRFNAWMRKMRNEDPEHHIKAIKDLALNEEKFSISVKNREIILQRKEFEIMSLLFSKPRKVFSRHEIKAMVWGDTQNVRNRTIDVHIRNLRSKIGPRYIKTYKGIGYSFEA